jgi:hypothetical protein
MRQGKAIVGLAGAIVLIGSAPAAADIGPVGVWPFNEGRGTVAYDYSGHHNNGTLEGLAEWAPGRFQKGLNFNGNAAAVRVRDSSSLDPASVTVSAWVKSTSPGNYKYIVAKGANGCLAASFALYTGANGGLQFYVSPGQGTSATLSPEAGPTVWNGEWHNVVGTYDGSSVRLYVDGQQVGAGTPDTVPIGYGLPGSNDLTIGDYTGCPSFNADFSGGIDEVKLFDRALAPWEIGLGYNFSRGLPPSFPFDFIF